MHPDFFRSKRFVALMAALTGLTAMGIDAVLPIFPQMIDYFALPEAEHNRIQQVVFAYMMGFALFQLLFGLLADVLGRKPLLLFGIGIYSLAAFSVLFIQQFDNLLWARFIQGAGLAAPRVLSMTIVRDVSSGREMSRIMSFVTMVFLAIPALAPMVGQLMVLVAPWQSVFVLLTVFGFALLWWVFRDLPETLAAKDRHSLKFDRLAQAIGEFLSHKATLLYLVMMSLQFSALMTYIGQAEQILQKDIYHLGEWFPLFFALIVLGMISAAMTNAKIVMRIGMRKIVFAALLLLVVADGVFFVTTILNDGAMPLWSFTLLLIIRFFGFGLSMPNLNALILEPYHHIAGTASALIGTLSTIIGVLIARFISHFFDGTLYAMAWGFIVCSILTWGINTYLRRDEVKGH